MANATHESLPVEGTNRAIWQMPLGSLRPGLTVVGTLVGLILLQPLMALLGNVAFLVLIFAWYYRGLAKEQQQQLERRAVGWLRNGLRSLRGQRSRVPTEKHSVKRQ